MGTGKKLERTLFFPFRFLHFLRSFFSRFWRKSLKTGEKRLERPKKGWKDMERRRTAVPRRSKLSNLTKFHFLCRLKPVFASVPTLFLPRSKTRSSPLSKPVFSPFLYCLAIISRCAPVAAQPLDHVGSSPVRGPVGGLYSWRGDARDQFA